MPLDYIGTLQRNTSQMAGAYADLGVAKSRAADRKVQATRAFLGALADAGSALRQYKTWKEAKEAEDDEREVAEADALGRSTGDPSKSLATLGAVKPRTGKGATLRTKLLQQAQEDTLDATDRKLREANLFLNRQKYTQDIKAAKEQTEFKRAELELERGKARREERKLRYEMEHPKPTQTENIDPLSDAGINAAVEKEKRVGEVKSARDKDPDGLDQPIPPRTLRLLESKAGLKSGDLEGLSYREWSAMKTDPQQEMLEQLRVIAAQRQVAEHEPPALKRARAELAKAEKDLIDFKDRAAAAPITANRKAMAQRVGELEKDVTNKRKGVEAAEAAGASGATPGAAPPTGEEDPIDAELRRRGLLR